MKCQNAFQSGAESSPKTLPFFQANSYSKFGLFGVETDWTGTLTWRWLARDYFSLLQFFWLTLVHTLSGAACIWTSHTLHCHTDVFARRSLWHSLPVQYRNISRNRSVYFGYAMIYCSLDWCLFDSSIIQQVTYVKVTFAIWSSLLNNGVNTGVTSSQCSTWGQSAKRVEKQKVSSHVPMGSFYRLDILPQKDVFWAVQRFPPSLKLKQSRSNWHLSSLAPSTFESDRIVKTHRSCGCRSCNKVQQQGFKETWTLLVGWVVDWYYCIWLANQAPSILRL